MNTTTTNSTITTELPQDLDTTLGAVFFGFAIGAILFGIGVRQAFEYYTNSKGDQLVRKVVVGAVCFLDALHLSFSSYMVYSYIVSALGFKTAQPHIVWSLKALGSTQVLLIILVQGFYLSQIWRLSGNLPLTKKFGIAIHLFVVIIAFFAIAVAVIFLSQLQKITVIHSFELKFEYIAYLGFGATAIVDCAIAAAMCVLLHTGSAGTLRSENVLETLILYFIGSGLLTSLAAILTITLYVAQPNTLLYLALQLSVTRLYANSLFAISNGRKSIRDRLNKTIDLEQIPSGVWFREPDQESLITPHQKESSFSPQPGPLYSGFKMVSDPFESPIKGKHMIATDPFSPGEETKFSPTESDYEERHPHNLSRATSSTAKSYTL